MSENHRVEILLIEDNAADQVLIQRALKKACADNPAAVARDGPEALEFLFGENGAAGRSAEDQLKMIVLDLDLPKMDGFEVLQRLKRDPRTKAIPVVVFSASQALDDELKSYRLGANSFVVKPVNFDEFDTAVQELGMYWLLLV